jgi:hypothetical protein
MQDTNNHKNRTDRQLPPDHYNIRISKYPTSMALINLPGLPNGLVDSQPSKTNREAQRRRGDDKVTSRNLLGFVVGGEEG